MATLAPPATPPQRAAETDEEAAATVTAVGGAAPAEETALLRADAVAAAAFCRHSVDVRLVAIFDRIIADSSGGGAAAADEPAWLPAVRELRESIAAGAVLPGDDAAGSSSSSGSTAAGVDDKDDDDAADAAAWRAQRRAAAAAVSVADAQALTWRTAPWFFVEAYAYRVLARLTQFAQNRVDPFAAQKAASLTAGRDRLLALLQGGGASGACGVDTASGGAWPIERLSMAAAVRLSLFGNDADLSRWVGGSGAPVAARGQQAAVGTDSRLLIDDTAAVVAALEGGAATLPEAAEPKEVHIVLDNAGVELFGDLALALRLLSPSTTSSSAAAAASRVVLWCKAHPTFVSDVVTEDLQHLLDWLRDPAQADDAPGAASLADAVEAALGRGALELRPSPWCNGADPLFAAPPAALLEAVATKKVRAVVVKGDANYRRVLGDCRWPPTTPTREAADAVAGGAQKAALAVLERAGTALVLLRTLKSGVCVGLSPESLHRARTHSPDTWLTSGHFALLHRA